MLFNVFVCPILEFGYTIWSPNSKLMINKLECIQRKYTKIIFRRKNLSYTERLRKLGLLSLEKRRLLLDLTQIYKCVHKLDSFLSPSVINIKFSPSNRHKLNLVPKLSHTSILIGNLLRDAQNLGIVC